MEAVNSDVVVTSAWVKLHLHPWGEDRLLGGPGLGRLFLFEWLCSVTLAAMWAGAEARKCVNTFSMRKEGSERLVSWAFQGEKHLKPVLLLPGTFHVSGCCCVLAGQWTFGHWGILETSALNPRIEEPIVSPINIQCTEWLRVHRRDLGSNLGALKHLPGVRRRAMGTLVA